MNSITAITPQRVQKQLYKHGLQASSADHTVMFGKSQENKVGSKNRSNLFDGGCVSIPTILLGCCVVAPLAIFGTLFFLAKKLIFQ